MRELKFRAWDNTKKEWTLNIMECVSSSRGDIWIEPALKSHDVIIEQYTGLKDKNGKEVYEGDIVRDLGSNHEVKFCEMRDTDCSYFYQGWGFDDSSLYEEHDFVEVIGNIHENPELLEKEE